MRKVLLTAFIGCSITLAAHAATVVWSAAVANGVSLSNGTADPAGNLVRLGTFDFTGTPSQIDAQILALQNNPSTLDSHFTEFGHGSIGAGGDSNGEFEISTTGDSGGALAGKQLFLWAFQSTNNSSEAFSLSTAVQQGVFWEDDTVKTNWAMPGPPPALSKNIDLSELTDSSTHQALLASAHVSVGSFPTGQFVDDTSKPNFGLHLISVPEPATLGLGIIGLLPLLARRRRVF